MRTLLLHAGTAAGLLGGLTALAAPAAAGRAGDGPAVELYLYAAASLRDALEALAPRVEADLGVRLVLNLGASSDLARQIEAAGRADLFFAADEEAVDRLDRRGLLEAGSRRAVLSNSLVVVGPRRDAPVIGSAAALAGPAVRRVAIADPDVAPAGRYAREWLRRAGVWDAVQARLVPALDVRAALAAVETGAVDAGIVYRTDAMISRGARVLFVVPPEQAPRIVYTLAVLGGRPRIAGALGTAAWLAGPEAAPVFHRFGFLPHAP